MMSNVTLALLRERATLAAKKQHEGDHAHGTAGILAVGTLVEGILANLFVETVGKATKIFGARHAMDCARVYFPRFDEACKVHSTKEKANPWFDTYKKFSQIITTKEDADKWRKYVCAMLFPYNYKGAVIDETNVLLSRTKALAHYEGSAKYQEMVRSADETDRKRSVLSKAWAHACLYVARDLDNDLWLRSNLGAANKDRPFGMYVLDSDLLPEGVTPILDPAPIIIKTVRDARVQTEGRVRDPKTGNVKKVTAHATFGAFAAAWKGETAQSADTAWKLLFAKVAAQVDGEFDLPENARVDFLAACNKMISLKAKLDNAGKPVPPPAPMPEAETLTAKEIAEGKSLPSRMRVVN
jgi:hypothetical protein